MTEIYIITDGDYSDYHICSVFLDEKKAKEIQKRFGGNIEIYNADEINEYLKYGEFYSVSMDREGDTFKCYKLTTWEKIYWPLHEPMINIYTNSMVIVVHANDEKHAIKIANDIRRQTVADGKWD